MSNKLTDVRERYEAYAAKHLPENYTVSYDGRVERIGGMLLLAAEMIQEEAYRAAWADAVEQCARECEGERAAYPDAHPDNRSRNETCNRLAAAIRALNPQG